jgi:hypothetical protein
MKIALQVQRELLLLLLLLFRCSSISSSSIPEACDDLKQVVFISLLLSTAVYNAIFVLY